MKYCGLIIDEWCWENEDQKTLAMDMCCAELKRNILDKDIKVRWNR